MTPDLTYAQQLILRAAGIREMPDAVFQDNWNEYDDYNDCHGDYYDA